MVVSGSMETTGVQLMLQQRNLAFTSRHDRSISHVAWSYYLLNIRSLSSLLAGASKETNLRGADHQHNEGILYCS